MASSYTIKDAATDLSAYEVAATYKLLTVGYGDLEGTGNYKTVGVSKTLTKGLTVFAETQQADLDTGVDTTSWSIGSKFSF